MRDAMIARILVATGLGAGAAGSTSRGASASAGVTGSIGGAGARSGIAGAGATGGAGATSGITGAGAAGGAGAAAGIAPVGADTTDGAGAAGGGAGGTSRAGPERESIAVWTSCSTMRLEANVVPPGAVILLPSEASALASGPWQSIDELSLQITQDATVIRGVIALGESLAIGFRALAISANYAAQENNEEAEAELSRGALIFAFFIAIGFALSIFKVGLGGIYGG